MMRRVVLGALLVASGAGAQEWSAFSTIGHPGSLGDASWGAGASWTAWTRFGALLHPDVAARRSKLRIGLRAAYAHMRSSELVEYRCDNFVDPCTYDPHRDRTRHSSMQYLLMLGPVTRTSTRIDVGAGFATHRFSGDVDDDGWGFAATLSVSRRLMSRSHWWVTADYTTFSPTLNAELVLADASRTSLDPPTHSYRLGLTYRVRRA